MLIVSKHALDRYKERVGELDDNEILRELHKILNPQVRQIKQGLSFLPEVRIPIGDYMLAIISGNQKKQVVMTIRKRKY